MIVRSLLPIPALLEPVRCPSCGADQPERLLDHDSFGFPIAWVTCRQCGFVYSTPRPTETYMSHFYRHHFTTFYEGSTRISRKFVKTKHWHESARDRAARYASLVPRGGRVLDVGCGGGYFLYELRRTRSDC